MKTSEKGKQLLRDLEGLRNYAYADTGGAMTIGIGHLLTRQELTTGTIIINGKSINHDDNGLTNEQCFDLLAHDLAGAEEAVNRFVIVKISQNQFDALVSFVFNVGKTAFEKSTLLIKLNQGKYVEVPAQLMRWNKDGGVVVKGLTNRRKKEVELWNY